MRLVTTIIVAALFTGCASAPTSTEIASADYGKRPDATQCEEIAGRAIKRQLKDPDSARFEFATPTPCYQSWRRVYGDLVYGYVVRGTVNAKNSFGGYTGGSQFEVLIRNGSAVQAHIYE